jgi:hypothetical protein
MPWVDVEPLPEINGNLHAVLEPVRSLQRAWKAVVSGDTASGKVGRCRLP